MGSKWIQTTLGEVIRLQRGHDLPDSSRREGSVPILGSFGVTGRHDEARAKAPGVTIGRSGGSIGVVSFSNVDFWPLNTCLYVTNFRGNDPKFCFYWLKTLDLASFDSGSAQPSLNRNFIYHLPVHLPSPSEQRRISNLLDGLDESIRLKSETSKALEAVARTVFKSWFVDFDPVRAKAEGREPEGMDAATAALFPGTFEQVEGNQIPSGWSFRNLSQFIEINPTRSLSKARPAPYLDMANAPTSGPRPYAWIERQPISGCRFRNGDTLLAKITPCLENGKTAFVDFLEDGQTGWGSTEFIVLKPAEPIPAAFGYLLARYEDFRAFAVQSMSGTSGRQRVQVDQLAKFKFPIADGAVYGAFADIIDPMFAAISHNDNQAKTLAELRDTLLPRLISGKLRIREAEKLVGAAL